MLSRPRLSRHVSILADVVPLKNGRANHRFRHTLLVAPLLLLLLLLHVFLRSLLLLMQVLLLLLVSKGKVVLKGKKGFLSNGLDWVMWVMLLLLVLLRSRFWLHLCCGLPPLPPTSSRDSSIPIFDPATTCEWLG